MARKIKEIERFAVPGEDHIRGNVVRPPSAEENEAALRAKGWLAPPQTAHQAAGVSLRENPQGGSFVDFPPSRPARIRRDPWGKPVRQYLNPDDRARVVAQQIREGK